MKFSWNLTSPRDTEFKTNPFAKSGKPQFHTLDVCLKIPEHDKIIAFCIGFLAIGYTASESIILFLVIFA